MTNILLEAAPAGGSPMGMILMMVAIFAIMYFFMLRPQMKERKKIMQFQNQLAEGTEVRIGNGIHGVVKSVDLTKNVVEVKIARDVVVVVDKGAVFDASAPQRA